MPSKYIIHTAPVPNRFEPISPSGVMAWEEGCLKCPVCVKKRCVYHVYENRKLDPVQMVESLDNQCMNCFRCVQGCPGQLIHKSRNQEFFEIGFGPFTPEIIQRTWNQATTGQIPVSGAGYHGPFTGPGFDSMWTDMSEIVRPTRDGIHGREYISTGVDIGPKPDHIDLGSWDDQKADGFMGIPIPILFRPPGFLLRPEGAIKGIAIAAGHLMTLYCVDPEDLEVVPRPTWPYTLVRLRGKEGPYSLPEEIRGVELDMDIDWEGVLQGLKRSRGPFLEVLRIPVRKGMGEAIEDLFKKGIRVFHLEAGPDGVALDGHYEHLKDAIREAHQRLVHMKVRDQVTLLVSGGMAMAEHVAKAIICGADAVYVDVALQLALECRLCMRCQVSAPCPVNLEGVEPIWAAKRIINLIGAWHAQLLEVLGAMGLRDIRRLRGEMGRAMFFEELERGTFSDLNLLSEDEELEDY